MHARKQILTTVIVLCGCLGALCSYGQNYPTKSVRLVVPYPPGGSADYVARIIAQKLSDILAQQIVVDNRGGAAGNIGSDYVAKSAPDGYTLLYTPSSIAISPSLYANLPFDPVKDFDAVTLFALYSNILVVHASVPARSVQELISLAKAKPGQINYGSGGSGTAPHLAGELFNSMAGVKMVHVPYKGAGPAMTDLLAGQVQVIFASPTTALPHVRVGKLRALAVTSIKRISLAPEIPTLAESGLLGYDVSEWNGILAPRTTPREIINKINLEVTRIVRMPDVRDRLIGIGGDPIGSTPGEFAAFLKLEVAKWAKVVKDSGARVD